MYHLLEMMLKLMAGWCFMFVLFFIYFFIFVFWVFKTGSHFVGQTDLEFVMLLPQPNEC
jgi:hypothetical protein